MIFVTLGSQKFQFNRLLKEIDDLIENGNITDEVFAQSGYSDYIPKNYAYKAFLNRDEFSNMQTKADIIITHAGTGAIMGALKKGKKVIAVPRLAKYGEHVDDHQLQIIEQFEEMKLIYSCYDCDNLLQAIQDIKMMEFKEYCSNTETYISDIEEFINNITRN